MTTTNSPEAQEKCPACGETNCFDHALRKRSGRAVETTEAQPQGVELKPCPLCKSTDLFLRDIAGWELDCRGCELSLVLANDPSRDGLVARWNTRADLPRATAADTEEREAAACPEDVGFEEYIRTLQDALRPFAALHREGVDPNEAVLVRDGDWVLNRNLERAAKLTATTAPRAIGETTVETALKELREMFPRAEWTEVRLYWDDENGKVYEVEIGDFDPAKDRTVQRKFQHGTLADCMAQVRAAAQTKAESGEK